jgi:hypothetical protein
LISPASGSYTVNFAFGEPPREEKNKDFFNQPLEKSISGVKYNDLNGNGNRDSGEPGLKDWTINLEQPEGTVLKTAITGDDGSYLFDALSFGDYALSEVVKSGWTIKEPSTGKHLVTLSSTNPVATGKNFGNYNNNLPPKDPTLVPDLSSPRKAGTPIIWTAGATDPEGDPLQYRFFVRGPSPSTALRADSGYSTNKVWTWNTVDYPPGTYQVEVWIKDGKHAGPDSYDVKKTVSYALTSANLPPIVKALFPNWPSPQYVGSWVTWTALASDPEGDPIQYRYFLRGPSTRGIWMDRTGWSNNNRWVWPTNPTDVGFSEVLVAVRDGNHAGPSGSDDHDIEDYFIISVNKPPVITGFGSMPISPQSIGATVQWSASAYDPEGNPVFFRYFLRGPSTGGVWRLVRDWSTDRSWIWPTSPADAGTSEVQVQVRDGFHSTPSGWDDDAGALFTVQKPNLPPTLASLSPDRPSPQSAGTPVKWRATASDPNGDAVLYKFWLKGPATGNNWALVQDWSYSNSWVWANTPADAGAYSVYVYARDGYHAPASGYDSALGASYVLLSPVVEKRITTGSAIRDKPSLVFSGDGYLLALQSWEAGKNNQGDVLLQKFDPLWKMQKSIWVSNAKVYEDSPSLAFVGGYAFVAYVSSEKGNRDIFVKKYDSNLNLVETRQLTSSPADQNSPSLAIVGNDFYLAYLSWDTGKNNAGGIFLTRYDQKWKPLATVQLTDRKFSQDRPSLAYAEGNFYVAYVSSETGNKDIFQKKLNAKMEVLETKKMTSDKSDQDYPFLKWTNGQFMLLYASKKTGNYELMLDRYLRDGKLIGSTIVVAAPGDQTASSMAFSPVDGMYWAAYASKDAAGQNIYVKPLKLAAPAILKPCDIVAAISSTKANSPYTLTMKFYNNYGELTDPDPMTLNFGWSPQDAVKKGDQLQRISKGTFQLKSSFGAKGDKSFRIGAIVDGCISAKTIPVKVT